MEKISLNSKQIEAVNHIDGPLLVIAGAGSGKTRVVTERIMKLIEIGILPSEILALTFTNKAAEEMKTRIMYGIQTTVLTCTFHSLGAKILRQSIDLLGYKKDFTIYDSDDSLRLLKSCLQSLNIKDEKGLLKQLQGKISQAKNDLLKPHQIDISKKTSATKTDKIFLDIFPLYLARLKEYNAVDFDDLLYLTVQILQEHELARKRYQNSWKYVLIDEYQDTNYSQYMLSKTLVEKHKNIFAVGDPDQSIYSWRGALYQNILNFGQDFQNAKIIQLEQNYRSTNNILSAANALIQNNPDRYEKNLWSELSDGEKISFFTAENERDEADIIVEKIFAYHEKQQIPYEDMVIFYRTNFQSRIFEDKLLAKKIPYIIYGGLSFYQRKEIKDILAFLRLMQSNSDFISFARTINIPKRGIGLTTIRRLLDLTHQTQISILDLCDQLLEFPARFPIKLSIKQKQNLSDYLQIIRSLKNQDLPIHDLISEIVLGFKYLDHLKEDPESFDDRKDNINELIAKATQWSDDHENPTLSDFLEELTLMTSSEKDTSSESVRLMTLHNGKGLEFNTVFIAGLEEDILPHINSKHTKNELEEERRLFYVGMTRAKKHLHLSHAIMRFLWGTTKIMTPSRFIKEIPSQFIADTVDAKIITSNEEMITTTEGLFSIGNRVKHPSFGPGIIEKIYDSSFGKTYDVYFEEDQMMRSLVGKFAKLQLSN